MLDEPAGQVLERRERKRRRRNPLLQQGVVDLEHVGLGQRVGASRPASPSAVEHQPPRDAAELAVEQHADHGLERITPLDLGRGNGRSARPGPREPSERRRRGSA